MAARKIVYRRVQFVRGAGPLASPRLRLAKRTAGATPWGRETRRLWLVVIGAAARGRAIGSESATQRTRRVGLLGKKLAGRARAAALVSARAPKRPPT